MASGQAADGPEPRDTPTPGLRERFGALRHLPRLVARVWRTSPVLTATSLLLRLLRALQPALVLYIGKLIVDEIVLQTRGPALGSGIDEWLAGGRLTRLGEWLALEFALVVASDVLGRGVTLVDGILAERYSNAVSIELMEHAASLDLTQFESAEFQDGLERARRQAGGRNTLVAQIFGQAQGLVTVAALAAGLLVYAPVLTLLLLVGLIPSVRGEAHFNARTYRLSYRQTPERRELDYVRYLGAGVDAVREIKLFGLSPFLIDRFRRLANGMFDDNRRIAARRAAWGTLFATLGTLIYYVAYAVIAWRTVRGELSLGDLTFLAGSFLRLHGLFESLLLGFTQIASKALYLDDLYSFFDLRPAIVSPPRSVPFPSPLQSGIAFEGVGFRYPDSERWAVRGLTFSLPAGEVLGLVGENGAGKTTIVKLLTRLYDPDEGRILVDGIDLRDFALPDLHNHIGVIFQDFVRYSLSAGENIAVGRIEAAEDQDRIAGAAESGLADAVIAKLPLGYAQPLGRLFHKGTDLSGGEWQKPAIARGYMRDADLLVLDEPTAALDARSEAEVFARFKRLAHGRTAMLISHRFSTLRMADRIIVLEAGRIVEAGRHADLVALGGRYAELFDLQAAGYR